MINKKDTNPKDAIGIKKVPFSVIPAQVTAQVGLALLEGAIKYARHNYRVAGVRASVYYDALMRHITAWWEGENIDKESGLPHPVKAIACLYVIMDAINNDIWVDDRPPKLKNQNWINELNELAKKLIEKMPPALEPYTELNKTTKE